MKPELPPAIAAFFQAHNTGQTGDFNKLFTDDALVSDEAHEYRGAAIKEWLEGAIAKYKPIHWRPSKAWRLSEWEVFPKALACQRQNEFKDLTVWWVI